MDIRLLISKSEYLHGTVSKSSGQLVLHTEPDSLLQISSEQEIVLEQIPKHEKTRNKKKTNIQAQALLVKILAKTLHAA